MLNLTPAEYLAWTQQSPKPDHRLIDVRESWELQTVMLAEAEHCPLGNLVQAHTDGEFDGAEQLVFLCHHGVRSAQACYFFEQEGFQTINIKGGIDLWAQQVAPTLPRY